MRVIEYDRNSAVKYAKRWAHGRNPDYYDFSRLGGDCTNYASQCLLAGCKSMNYTPILGWYYKNSSDRTPSWTGVEYFYNFLISNKDGIGTRLGPFAEEVDLSEIEIGDFIQLGRATGDYYHCPVVVGFSNGEPLISAHSFDVYAKPLSSYLFEAYRCIHVLGARI